MNRETIIRFSIPFREAMSALLAEEQIDAESYEIRVIGQCVVVDLINPVHGQPLPVRSEEEIKVFVEEQIADIMGGDGDEAGEEAQADEGDDAGIPDADEVAGQPDDPEDHENDMSEGVDEGGDDPAGDVGETADGSNADANDEVFYKSPEEKKPKESRKKQGGGQDARDDSGEREVHPNPRAQRCALLCKETRFQVFMDEKGNEDGCIKAVRQTCGVKSRAELDTDPKASREWDRLLAEYDQWCRS